MNNTSEKIQIAISSCLVGQAVRYDGTDKKNDLIVSALHTEFELVPFCPEVAIGLGIPRAPIELVVKSDGIHCVGVEDKQLDVTAELGEAASAFMQQHPDICGYIFKARSPSCGVANTAVSGQSSLASGVFAASIMKPGSDLPVTDESRLTTADSIDDFRQRVLAYRHSR